MTKLKELLIKNAVWLTLSQIINNIVGYILIVAIARNLGDVGLGQYSFLFALVGLTFIFADMGLGYLMIKEISRNEKKAQYYFENLFLLKLFLGILSFIITLIISFFLHKEEFLIRALWIVGIINIFVFINNFISSFFISFNRMDIEAISLSIERLTALILGLYFLYTTQSLIFFIIALLISVFARFLFLIYKVKKKVKFKFQVNLKLWMNMIKEAFPFFLTAVFIYIYFRIDTVMLSLMKGDEVTGWYNAAYKLIDVLSVIPFFVITAILPSMSKLYKEDKKLLKQLFIRVLRYLLMLVIPITMGTLILADRIINFIYGNSFIGGTLSLQILIFAELFLFVNYLIGNLFNSIDKQRYFMVITGICALFNIALNFILIPNFSYAGAAIATVLTEFLNFVLLRKYLKDFFIKITFNAPLIKSVVAAIVMGIVVYYFRWLALWYVIPIGIFVYVIMLIILKLEDEDKFLISQIMGYLKPKF